MKTLIKFSGFLLLALFTQSCGIYKPISTKAPENNETYKVDYLFEHEGCKVYRFHDMGHYVYFTNCAGDVTSIKKDSTEARVINQIRNIQPK